MINITQKHRCNGCHACFNVCPKSCIAMKSDNEGFLYPNVDKEKCIKCGLCVKKCPILNEKHNLVKTSPKAYAMYNKNEKIRLESSSGGIFTLIAEEIINLNGVVFGACFDENLNVVHDYAEHIEDLQKFRSSKYVQSKIGNTYKKVKDFLEENKIVLFTGTPCQIGGLCSYLGKKYDNLITQDIICHGVPSPQIYEKYVDYREEKAKSKAQKINFRNKNYGWKTFSMYVQFENKVEYVETLKNDSLFSLFLKNVDLRPSCYKCSFKNINRQSDITLADFWGVQHVMPEMDDNKGTSLVIVNSEKGEKLFEQIKNDSVYKQADLSEALKYNTSMTKSVEPHKNREKFFAKIDSFDFEKDVKKYCELRFTDKIKRKLFSKS